MNKITIQVYQIHFSYHIQGKSSNALAYCVPFLWTEMFSWCFRKASKALVALQDQSHSTTFYLLPSISIQWAQAVITLSFFLLIDRVIIFHMLTERVTHPSFIILIGLFFHFLGSHWQKDPPSNSLLLKGNSTPCSGRCNVLPLTHTSRWWEEFLKAGAEVFKSQSQFNSLMGIIL